MTMDRILQGVTLPGVALLFMSLAWSAETLDQGSIVVSEKRRGIAEVDPHWTPLAMERIELAPYRARAVSLEEILEKKSGVQIRRFGGPGSYSTISLRGSSASQVAVFIDGVPLNRGARSEVDLSNYSLDNLEAIEVYQGMAPAKFGVSPIGGVLNLVTRKAPGQTGGHAKVEVGSFGTRAGALDVGTAGSDWNLHLNADKLHSDGDYDYVDDRRTPNDTTDDLVKTRINNDVTRDSFLIKAGLPGAHGNRFDLTLQASEKDQGLPGRGKNQTRNTRFSTAEQISDMSYGWRGLGVPGSDLDLHLMHGNTREHYSDLDGPSGELGLGRQDNYYHLVQDGVRLTYERVLPGHLLESDYGFSREEYAAQESFSVIQPGASARSTHTLALQDQLDFSGGRWVVVPAVKGSLAHNEFGDTTGLSATSGRSFNHQSLDLQLGVRRRLTQTLEWLSNAGSASREPSFYELFGDRGNRVGNAALEDERSFNWDTGLRFTPRLALTQVSDVWIYCSYFESRQKDLIQMVFDARGVGRAENISATLIKGVELESGITLGKNLHLQQQWTGVDSRIEDSRFASEVGKNVPSVYARTWSAKASYDLKHASPYVELLMQENMYYDRSNLLRAADKDVLNAGIKFKIKKCESHLEVKNLTDDQIEDFSGWPLPGRSYHFSLLFTF